MCADPKSAKRQSSHQCLLALFGSAGAKVARKTFVKSALVEKKIFQSKKLSSIKVRKNQSQIIRRLQKYYVKKQQQRSYLIKQ